MAIDTLHPNASIRLAVIAGAHGLDEEQILLVLEAARQIAGTARAIAMSSLEQQRDAGNPFAGTVLAQMEAGSGTIHECHITEAYEALYAREGQRKPFRIVFEQGDNRFTAWAESHEDALGEVEFVRRRGGFDAYTITDTRDHTECAAKEQA